MKNTLLRSIFLSLLAPTAVWGCPFCNVDGPAVRGFILTVLGAAILGAVFVFVWSWTAGQYQDVEKPKHRILEIDESTGVDLGRMYKKESPLP